MKLFLYYYYLEKKLSVAFTLLADTLNLAARAYLATVFFRSGLTKIRDWDSTLFLFKEEYHVPLLPPNFAAYLGTAGELTLPIFLLLGFFSRFSAVGLFIVNATAAISLSEVTDTAVVQHLFWGSLALYLVTQGGLRFSIDRFIGQYYAKNLTNL